MIWDLFINEGEKIEKDSPADDYGNLNSTSREGRCLDCPSSMAVQNYLRLNGFLP